MTDEKNTEPEIKAAADGTDCPAAYPLCVCGVRGCPSSKAHRRQMSASTRRRHRI